MNDKEWKNINEHMKNKFINEEKTEVLKTFPNKDFINKMEDNKIYKTLFSCIAINIINSKNKLNEFDYEDWSKMLSEFTYGITKIMKIYHAQYIRIQGDEIYGIFVSDTKEQIDKVLDCCVELNTFKTHLNKQIHKSLFNRKNGDKEDEMLIDYGVGVWFSFENYISSVGSSKTRDIVFMGDAVNYANYLAKEAGRNGMEPILINQLLLENITKEYKSNNKNIWDFKEYQKINDEKIYGFSWIFTKYLNWIKNNS